MRLIERVLEKKIRVEKVLEKIDTFLQRFHCWNSSFINQHLITSFNFQVLADDNMFTRLRPLRRPQAASAHTTRACCQWYFN